MAPSFTNVLTSEAELRSIFPPPGRRAQEKQIDHLDDHCRALIAHAPFVAIGTTNAREPSCRRYGSARIAAPTSSPRIPLRESVALFDALGATAWSKRARQELRATGEKVGRRAPDLRDRLTAQELQIAQLAAEGLSNRQIAERLFLSPRTIGGHLYRIFPKLQITARAQLRDAFADRVRD